MLALNSSVTELTTAATDAAMAALCLFLLSALRRVSVRATWKKNLWSWVFALTAAASTLGAIAHGFDLSERARSLLWLPLYLSLGLSIALFVVGGLYDWRGERGARTLLPWAIGVGIVFFAITQLAGGAFVLFVAYEAVAMISALGMYLLLASRRRFRGAWLVSAGISLTLIAAAVQASPLRLRVIVPFDHNGLFHIVQLIATPLIAIGIRRGLLDVRGVRL